MAKQKVNKKVVRKRRKAQAQPPKDQGQDQPDRKGAVSLPRIPRLRLSQLPGPLSFRLAGGRLIKDDA